MIAQNTLQGLLFKWGWVGWALIVLNVLMAINSTYFFLGVLKVGPAGWLMMNTCVPSIAFFTIGFLLKSPLLMIAGDDPSRV